MKSLLLFTISALLFTVHAKRQKLPKGIKQLNQLCLGRDANQLNIKDETFTFVFEEMNVTCNNLSDAMEGAGKVPSTPLDAIKVLGKICKWYTKSYDENTTVIVLDEVDTVCENYGYAQNGGIDDKTSKKTMKKLSLLCKASQRDNVDVKNASFTDVFVAVDDFCVTYMDTQKDVEYKAKRVVNGIKILDQVCSWYTEKFFMVPEVTAPGVMAELQPICSEFNVLTGVNATGESIEEEDGEETFNILNEPECQVLVDMCQAEQAGEVTLTDPTFADVFTQLWSFCDGFLLSVQSLTELPAAESNENEEEGDGESTATEGMDVVEMLSDVCEWQTEVQEENGQQAILNGLDGICVDFEALNGEETSVGGSAGTNEGNLMAEEGFQSLVALCTAQSNGQVTTLGDNYADSFDSLSSFCGPFLLDVQDSIGGTLEVTMGDPLFMFYDACQFVDEYEDEEGETNMFADLEPACDTFIDRFEDDTQNFEQYEMTRSEEFMSLVNLCGASLASSLSVPGEEYADTFAALNSFCAVFQTQAQSLVGQQDVTAVPAPVDTLDDICEWSEDMETTVGGNAPGLLDGLDTVCAALEAAEEAETETED